MRLDEQSVQASVQRGMIGNGLETDTIASARFDNEKPAKPPDRQMFHLVPNLWAL